MRIRFRPVTKVRKRIDGKLVVIFSPKYVYDGLLNHDRTVLGYNRLHDIHVELKLNDYMIERD